VTLAVEIAGVKLKNPLIAASGTFGYGVEYEGILDLGALGGLVSKGLYMEPRAGCPTPRIAETPSGLLNAIGLQGVGVRAFVADVLPRLRPYDTAVFINVCGDTVDEYAEVTRVLDGAPGVAGVEINISCPNVKKGGMAFGGDPRMTHEVISAVRKATKLPVIPKV
jgi:dihydroorotate dehydrogenase (NAD+) catalytic subunit